MRYLSPASLPEGAATGVAAIWQPPKRVQNPESVERCRTLDAVHPAFDAVPAVFADCLRGGRIRGSTDYVAFTGSMISFPPDGSTQTLTGPES